MQFKMPDFLFTMKAVIFFYEISFVYSIENLFIRSTTIPSVKKLRHIIEELPLSRSGKVLEGEAHMMKCVTRITQFTGKGVS